jgi:hypothetical protein
MTGAGQAVNKANRSPPEAGLMSSPQGTYYDTRSDSNERIMDHILSA